MPQVGKSLWIIILILSLAPLTATILDIMRGRTRLSIHNVAVGYLLYAFRIAFLLTAQFTIIPILFLIGPVWLFAVFLTVADLVARWGANAGDAGTPLFCNWLGIDPTYCGLVLIAYHAVSVVLAYVTVRHGKRLFEALADWHRRGAEWLAGQTQPQYPTQYPGEDVVVNCERER
jgi:hypothetical protein